MAVVVLIITFLIIKSVRGAKYWTKCEKYYDSLLASGYSKENALLQISRERHQELSETTHLEIVNKFNDVHLLVNFITNALETPRTKLNDKHALSLVLHTSIEHLGDYQYKVHTDWQALSNSSTDEEHA